MNKNKFTFIIIIILLCTSSINCKKFVTIGLPKDQLTSTTVFADSTNADAAILGIYIDMLGIPKEIFSGGVTCYTGLSSDELYQSKNDINSEFYSNTITSNNSTVSNLWSNGYKIIYAINACMEGVHNSPSLEKRQKISFLNELKIIRSYAFFIMVNLFGSIPLTLSTDYRQNKSLKQSTSSEVYQQIIKDLNYAKSNMNPKNRSNTRAGYYAATALLARVYLYTRKFDSAKIEADEVISSNKYSLEDLNNVFNLNSKEIIWGMLPVSQGKETYEGYYFIPASTSAIPNFILTNELYNSFTQNDLRKSNWTNYNEIEGKIYPYPFKYKKRKTDMSPTECYSIIRLAELYLIRSEAEANLNELSDALQDLNKIRNRAGLQNRLSFNKDSILLFIEKERRWEFMCESGNRWFDLKRTNRANSILSKVKTNWESTDVLFPIPAIEISRDPFLIQNNGYN